MSELTPAQKRKSRMVEFNQHYGQYWLIYVALIMTASLSFVSGLILPFHPDTNGRVILTFGGIALAIYFAIGFVTNGEGAAGFWFEKITDHDKDNNAQKWIAWTMLIASVIVSLVTSLAAAAQLAYLLGVLSEFQAMPTWAQDWVVWSIPTMWIANAVSGMAFKSVSDEAEAERESRAIIREAMLTAKKAREQVKADFWKQNANRIFAEMGREEAQADIEIHRANLEQRKIANGVYSPVRQYAKDAEAVGEVNPSTRPSQQ